MTADAATGGGAGKSDGKKNRVATAKDLLGPRIMLDGQPAVGLFVLFAPVPSAPADASKDAPATPAPKFTVCFVDGQGYPQTVLPDKNPWAEIGAQLDYLAKARHDAEKKGRASPIFAAKPCLNPHVFKLAEDASYKLCLVAHPNMEYALAMQAFLNDGKADARFKFPKKDDVVFEAKVATDDDEGGKVAHIDLPTDAKSFWPAGHSRYGGWMLYQDMPHAHVKGVREAVSQLACDLASLRYPTGESGNLPYPASTSDHSGRFGTTLMATVHAFQRDAAAGNALMRLNVTPPAAQSVPESWSFLLASAGAAQGTAPASIAPVSAVPSPGAAASESDDEPDPLPTVESNVPKLPTDDNLGVGVVTAAVGDAIAAWVKAKYRKNGPIVVRATVAHDCWGRWEMVQSLALWDLMAKALGCAYGIKLSCTFRELTVPAGVGRVECSNHKLGLSVDLMGATRRESLAKWPIYWEANWVPSESGVTRAENKRIKDAESQVQGIQKQKAKQQDFLDGLEKKKAAGKPIPAGAIEATQSRIKQLDDDEKEAQEALASEKKGAAELDGEVKTAKANYVLYWRLYGHSSLKLWNPPAKPGDAWPPIAPAEAQVLLAQAFGVVADGPWEIEKKMGALVRKNFPDTTDPGAKAAIDRFVGDAEKLARKVAGDLHAMAAKEGAAGLVASLFRREIRPFEYNPIEADGGTSRATPLSVETDPKVEDAKELFGQAPVLCYLNLTRLAFECGMNRISAQRAVSTGTFKNPTLDPEFKPKVAPQPVTFDLSSEKKRKTHDIASMLGLLAQTLDDMAKAKLAKAKVKLDDGTEKDVDLGDLDSRFMKAWSDIMGKSSGLAFDDISLSLAVSADEAALEAKKKQVNFVAEKTFRLAKGGALLKMDGELGQKRKLSAWIDLLAEKSGQLDKEQKKKLSRYKLMTDWTMQLAPCFAPSSENDRQIQSIVVPPFGASAPLEWWHHDSHAMAGSWASMAEQIGYSGVVIRADDIAPPAVVNGLSQGGLGFDPKKVDRVRKPSNAAPENWSDIPDGG